MSIISTILVVLVSLEFFFIMYLETIKPTSDQTSRVFSISKKKLEDHNIQTLLKNQGVYNGLIGVMLLYGAFISENPKEISLMLLIFIIGVAIYGGISSDKSIFFKQGTLPIIAVLSILFLA
ncbi:DUF1304 domain-containing protein [Staphylococcus sp. IVB6246]|uniref:DUF1304 domain-containing protein n=1 Tax=unclassified Staphylococcus TaxID=91994 RepID=UPI0021CF8A3C|nr:MULTISPECIES: DUF1304 domain-containing protein [unclassified Staphylococcus]UXR70012.1 DUF1304 domain-containing protein [Staphylococcus sp. IVB6246]UXR72052.1 DUF1304 domain-containing protein [Staphylococcus sp. IVB6240]UXR74360.1 DUF1304 domain-containing protein [Staphylococcus sp. IVB6238]